MTRARYRIDNLILRSINEELTKKVKELETQVEIMKKCGTCKHYYITPSNYRLCGYCEMRQKECKENNMKLWEIVE